MWCNGGQCLEEELLYVEAVIDLRTGELLVMQWDLYNIISDDLYNAYNISSLLW